MWSPTNWATSYEWAYLISYEDMLTNMHLLYHRIEELIIQQPNNSSTKKRTKEILEIIKLEQETKNKAWLKPGTPDGAMGCDAGGDEGGWDVTMGCDAGGDGGWDVTMGCDAGGDEGGWDRTICCDAGGGGDAGVDRVAETQRTSTKKKKNQLEKDKEII